METRGMLTARIGTSGSMDPHRILGYRESKVTSQAPHWYGTSTELTKHDIPGADEDDVKIISATDVGGSKGGISVIGACEEKGVY